MFKKIYILVISILIVGSAFGQISHGGTPASFAYPHLISSKNIIDINVDTQKINDSRESDCKEGCSKQIGVFVEEIISLYNSSKWEELPDGSVLFSVAFRLEDAQAVGISFSQLNIPENGKLFVYNPSFQNVYGHFNQSNILPDGSFSIQPVNGNTIYLEFNCEKENAKELNFVIDGFSYFFETDFFNNTKEMLYDESGDCQVNINCPEGASIRQSANAVVKIITYGTSGYRLCTGTVVNNTRHDRTPYVLSAWHCSEYTKTAEHYQKWMFYFLYEVPLCSGIQQAPENKTLAGCTLVSASQVLSNPISSDFLLVKLINSHIPPEYDVYYAGWDATGSNVSNAKSVHHPKGDVKKVSETENITVDTWSASSGSNPTHLKVVWKQTQSGYGTTEGGSSGSPLFNANGHIIGTLTGGYASCDLLNSPDFYGRLSRSWTSNDIKGNDPTKRLDCWLDPDNSGIKSLGGYKDGINVSNIKYSVNHSETYVYGNPTITVGGNITFRANFFGEPDSCHWEFEGGQPSFSNQFEPEAITYNEYGKYPIKLTLYKEGSVPLTFSFPNYLSVSLNIYPNPFEDKITVIFNSEITDITPKFKEIRLVDMGRRIAHFPNKIEQRYNILDLYFDNVIDGVYLLQIITDEDVITKKLLKTKLKP